MAFRAPGILFMVHISATVLTTTCCAVAQLVHSAVWLDTMSVKRLCAVQERWLVHSAV